MADRPVTNKRQMYRLLAAGEFGNTIRQHFDIASWEADPESRLYPVWGVRTLTPGGPCRLFCPREEVRPTAEEFQRGGHPINISLMIDTVCNVSLMADVWDSDTGLVVYGVERPAKGASWRRVMPEQGRHYEGLAARMLLRRHLNSASLEDLDVLRERWPGHVYEMSVCDRCIGTVPGRNAVLWEVRQY